MHEAPTAVYSPTTSGIVRSPISWPPSASWRLTSMMIGRRPPSSASMKTLGIAYSSPRVCDRLDATGVDPAAGLARVGVDVDPEEKRVRHELLVPFAVLGRDPAGEQERPAQ